MTRRRFVEHVERRPNPEVQDGFVDWVYRDGKLYTKRVIPPKGAKPMTRQMARGRAVGRNVGRTARRQAVQR